MRAVGTGLGPRGPTCYTGRASNSEATTEGYAAAAPLHPVDGARGRDGRSLVSCAEAASEAGLRGTATTLHPSSVLRERRQRRKLFSPGRPELPVLAVPLRQQDPQSAEEAGVRRHLGSRLG